MASLSSGARLPAVGERFAGKYDIVRLLGEGGMGAVFEAQHVRLRQPVAIKLLLPRFQRDRELAARFEREARAAAQIQGPHVARVMDVDTTADGVAYIVMELVSGRDLAAELEACGTLPLPVALDYVLQACTAMIEAHALGIVHRDLKPSNLMLARRGLEVTVKVLDFGVSKTRDSGELATTTTNASLGTPLYMSPEQIRSAKNVDARADVWALGAIFFELLTGRAPFLAPSATAVAAAIVADPPASLRDLRPGIPEPIERVILRALRKSPSERYPSAAAFADDLRALCALAAATTEEHAPHDPSHSARVRIGTATTLLTPALPRSDAITAAAGSESVTKSDSVATRPAWSEKTPTGAPQARTWTPVVLAAGLVLVAAGLFARSRGVQSEAPLAAPTVTLASQAVAASRVVDAEAAVVVAKPMVSAPVAPPAHPIARARAPASTTSATRSPSSTPAVTTAPTSASPAAIDSARALPLHL